MIYCCKGCVAPKRFPGCHSVCPEYLEQRAEYDKLKAEYDRKKDVTTAINIDRAKKVYNSLKGLRTRKY